MKRMTELELLEQINYNLEFLVGLFLFFFILLIFYGVLKLLDWLIG